MARITYPLDEAERNHKRRTLTYAAVISSLILLLFVLAISIFRSLTANPEPTAISPIPEPARAAVLGEEDIRAIQKALVNSVAELDDRITTLENGLISPVGTLYLSAPHSASFTGQNLIRNSSFESAEGGKPRQWTYMYDSTTGNTHQSNEGIRSGAYGLKFTGATSTGSGLDLGLSQPETETVPGRTYTLSFYLKHTNIKGEAYIRLGFWDRYNNRFGPMKVIPVTGTKDWTRVSTTVTTTGLITDHANWYPMIEVRRLKDGEAVYIDDVQMEEGSVLTLYNSAIAAGISNSFTSGFGDGSILATPNGQFYPALDGVGTLGTPTNRWNALYLSKATINENGDLSLDGTLAVGHDLTVRGRSTFDGEVTLQGDTALKNDLSVEGTTTLKGNVTLGDTTSDTITVNGTPTFTNLSSFAGGIMVGENGEFSINSTGDITKIKGISYSFPSAQGSVNALLMNDGAGGLSWGTLGAASVTPDSLDFTEFKDAMALDADTSINLYSGSARNMRFFNSNTASDLLFLDGATGRIGVGTQSPNAKLDVSGNIFPTTTLTHDLGSPTYEWNNLYLGGTLDLGTNTVTDGTFSGNWGFSSGNLSNIGTISSGAITATGTSSFASLATSGTLTLSDGTAGTPALAFTNDTNTGLYRLGADKIGLITGGSDSQGIIVDGSGNVGMGTTTPGYKLDIAGSLNFTGTLNAAGSSGTLGQLLVSQGVSTPVWQDIDAALGDSAFLQGGNTFGEAAVIGTADNYALYFVTNGTEQMAITNTGNVGIGTAAPSTLLSLGNTSYTFAASGLSFGDMDTGLYESADDKLNVRTAGSDRITIDSSGNVGIGTMNPVGRLVVKGPLGTGADMPATSGSTQSDGLIARLQNDSVTVLDIGSAGGYGNWVQSTRMDNLSSNFPLLLNPNGGNVGIGTTGPGANLEVYAPSGDSGSISLFKSAYASGGYNSFYDADGSATRGFIGYGATLFTGLANTDFGLRSQGGMAFGDAGSVNMYINTAGNVGIGTTAPGDLLEVSSAGGKGVRVNHVNTNSWAQLDFAEASTATNSIYSIGSAFSTVARRNNLELLSRNGGIDFSVGSAGARNVVINSSGNVGIGTTGPGANLEVYAPSGDSGSISLFKSAYASGGYNSFYDADGSATRGFIGYGATLFTGLANTDFGLRSQGGMAFGDAGSVNMYINTAGNVGIGTTAPYAPLTVRTSSVASTQESLVLLNPNTNAGTGTRLTLAAWESGGAIFRRAAIDGVRSPFGAGGDDGDLQFWTNLNGTLYQRMTILYDGNVGIGTTNPGYKLQVGMAGDGTEARANAWNTLSDQNLKEKITVIGSPLDVIEKLQGVKFNWKATGEESMGFIAQDLEQVLPQVVSTGADGYKSVNYPIMNALLVEGIKELNRKVDANIRIDEFGNTVQTTLPTPSETSFDALALENDIATLKDRIDGIEQRLGPAPVDEEAVERAAYEKQMASVSATLAAIQSDVEMLKSTQFTASVSAALMDADLSVTSDETTLPNLIVTGHTNVFDLAVTGRITNGLLAIDGLSCTDEENCAASVSTFSGPLRLQELAAGAVEIMAGKVVIDTNGDMMIDGKLTAGEVEAETVTTKNLNLENDVVFTSGDTAPTGTCQTGAVYVWNDKPKDEARMYICTKKAWEEVESQ